jgi:hypothetical protein
MVTISKRLWDITSQMSHFGCSAALMLVIRIHTSPRVAIIALVFALAIAAGKEFWYDYHYETVDERGSSLLDFVMYALGLVLGYVLA